MVSLPYTTLKRLFPSVGDKEGAATVVARPCSGPIVTGEPGHPWHLVSTRTEEFYDKADALRRRARVCATASTKAKIIGGPTFTSQFGQHEGVEELLTRLMRMNESPDTYFKMFEDIIKSNEKRFLFTGDKAFRVQPWLELVKQVAATFPPSVTKLQLRSMFLKTVSKKKPAGHTQAPHDLIDERIGTNEDDQLDVVPQKASEISLSGMSLSVSSMDGSGHLSSEQAMDMFNTWAQWLIEAYPAHGMGEFLEQRIKDCKCTGGLSGITEWLERIRRYLRNYREFEDQDESTSHLVGHWETYKAPRVITELLKAHAKEVNAHLREIPNQRGKELFAENPVFKTYWNNTFDEEHICPVYATAAGVYFSGLKAKKVKVLEFTSVHGDPETKPMPKTFKWEHVPVLWLLDRVSDFWYKPSPYLLSQQGIEMSWMEYLLDNRFAVRGVALLTDKSNSNGRGKGDGKGNGKQSGNKNGQKHGKGKKQPKSGDGKGNGDAGFGATVLAAVSDLDPDKHGADVIEMLEKGTEVYINKIAKPGLFRGKKTEDGRYLSQIRADWAMLNKKPTKQDQQLILEIEPDVCCGCGGQGHKFNRCRYRSRLLPAQEESLKASQAKRGTGGSREGKSTRPGPSGKPDDKPKKEKCPPKATKKSWARKGDDAPYPAIAGLDVGNDVDTVSGRVTKRDNKVTIEKWSGHDYCPGDIFTHAAHGNSVYDCGAIGAKTPTIGEVYGLAKSREIPLTYDPKLKLEGDDKPGHFLVYATDFSPEYDKAFKKGKASKNC